MTSFWRKSDAMRFHSGHFIILWLHTSLYVHRRGKAPHEFLHNKRGQAVLIRKVNGSSKHKHSERKNSFFLYDLEGKHSKPPYLLYLTKPLDHLRSFFGSPTSLPFFMVIVWGLQAQFINSIGGVAEITYSRIKKVMRHSYSWRVPQVDLQYFEDV